MRQSAARMIFGMMTIAILITVISGSPLAIVTVAAVGYVTWAAAKGLE